MHPLSKGARRGLLAGLLIATATGCGNQPERRPETGPAREYPAAIEIETLDGEATAARLAERPAPTTIVNLWATWCPPCVAELPDFERAGRLLAARGVDVLTLSMDVSLPSGEPVDADGVRRFLTDRQLVLPVWLYDGDLNDLADRLSWGGALPYTAILDQSGRVLAGHQGAMDLDGFLALHEEALTKKR